MKKLIIILSIWLSFGSCKAQLKFGGIMTSNTLNQRFRTGASYLVGNQSYENNCVLEASLLRVGDSTFVFYTAHHDTSAIALMTTDSVGGTQNKRGIVITRRSSGLNTVARISGTFYLFGVDWNGAADGYLYTSTTGYPPYTDHGIVINHTLIPSAAFLGNLDLVRDTADNPIQVSGKYQMIVEASNSSTFIFELHLVESADLLTWSYVQKLTTLQLGSGSYSGPCCKYLDGVYHMFYHYSSTGVLPTYLAYATSSDRLTWTIKEAPFKALEALPYGALSPPTYTTGTSQIADTYVEQNKHGNKVDMVAEYVQNSTPPLMVIYKWTYNGSFKQLITGLNNCLGCSGIFP